MRYLISINGQPPFLTQWFRYENHFINDVEMTVYDLSLNKYTTDGINWTDIDLDVL